MKRSATELHIENLIVRSTPAVYATVWALGIGSWLALDHAWLIALLTAVAYASMQLHEITQRGHCYLSADATAVPVSIAAYLAAIVLLILTGYVRHQDLDYFSVITTYGGVLVFGHVAAIGITMAAGLVLNRIFRDRIAAERQSASSDSKSSSF